MAIDTRGKPGFSIVNLEDGRFKVLRYKVAQALPAEHKVFDNYIDALSWGEETAFARRRALMKLKELSYGLTDADRLVGEREREAFDARAERHRLENELLQFSLRWDFTPEELRLCNVKIGS